jgi:hypothetical protein
VLSTPAGDVELRIPKVREGAFFPSLLEPRRRVDRALWAVIMTAYVTGTSTRKVDDLVKALGVESGISKSTVSRICEQLDEEVAAFRDRSLDHIEFPYVFVDVLVKPHGRQGTREPPRITGTSFGHQVLLDASETSGCIRIVVSNGQPYGHPSEVRRDEMWSKRHRSWA